MTLTPNEPATARSRPARLATNIRPTLYQAIADLAETALWLPGRYVAALRGWPGYPLDWPSHSYAAATALATAGQREPDLAAWLAAMLTTIPQGRGNLLAAALAATPDDSR
jgi:hypothetical protein